MRALTLLLAALPAFVPACSAPDHAPSDEPPASVELRPRGMKGWELYTWRAGGEGELRWTILMGTNRLKQAEEIVGELPDNLPGTTTGRGLASLEAELARFAPEAFVMWNFHVAELPDGAALAWPGEEELQRLLEEAAGRGVSLEVPDRRAPSGGG